MPGMANVHSHAFQRALAGVAEPFARRSTNFWSWREQMSDLALRLTPDQIEAVSAQAFLEMVKAGFTSVAEFITCTTRRMAPVTRTAPRSSSALLAQPGRAASGSPFCLRCTCLAASTPRSTTASARAAPNGWQCGSH
jgi:cytosine/adenosine deaminase-related metal-dependent hydrolase